MGWWLRIALVAGCLASACTVSAPSPSSPPAAAPIVILISLDGWRWDYLERFAPPALSTLAAQGVVADGLIPVFPSKTFPNHYSLITGLYPARHGILSNNIEDPALPGRFTLDNREVQQDTRWWGGEPLWVTVERQGQTAGTMFWPGSDVEIAGDRPTYWEVYDHDLPSAARVDTVLLWLQRSPQPTLLTMYFSDVDDAGHDFGPDDARTREAALAVDTAIARLVQGVERLRLQARVHYVIVSDHGMAALSPARVIVLDDYIDLATVDMIDSTPVVGLNARPGTSVDQLYAALRGKHASLEVFTPATLPAGYRLTGHTRLPDIVGVAADGWHITTRQRLERDRREGRTLGGNHGYDPAARSMHGLFLAAGPQLKSGARVPAFENVHVYELLCRLLNVKAAPNDGDPRVTTPLLR